MTTPSMIRAGRFTGGKPSFVKLRDRLCALLLRIQITCYGEPFLLLQEQGRLCSLNRLRS